MLPEALTAYWSTELPSADFRLARCVHAGASSPRACACTAGAPTGAAACCPLPAGAPAAGAGEALGAGCGAA